MRIADIMTPNAGVTTPDASCAQAARLMADHDIGVLPVRDGDRLVGMVTDRDICCGVVARERGADTPVREAMSSQVLYCREDDDPADVARNMADNAVRRLPVVNADKRLVGMISLSDIAERGKTAEAGESLSGIKQSN